MELLHENEMLRSRLEAMELNVSASMAQVYKQSEWLSRMAGILGEVARRAPLGQDKRDLVELPGLVHDAELRH